MWHRDIWDRKNNVVQFIANYGETNIRAVKHVVNLI